MLVRLSQDCVAREPHLSKMRSPDFLHKDAETRISEDYIAAGALCRLLTNSEQVLAAARETFLPLRSRSAAIDIFLRFWVDDTHRSQLPRRKPYVRGLDHLIFAGFAEDCSILANLRTRQIIGRFSPEMAEDRAYFKSVIFPMLLTIVSATVGVAELHCACVAQDRHGLLLAGPSGAGKSTLALALSQDGLGFVSDDRTFCSLENGDVHVWGLPTRLKLRAEGLGWFQELRKASAPASRDREAAVWLEPEHLSGVKRIRHGRATSLIFLERTNSSEFCLSPIPSTEALNRLTRELMAELPDAAARRSETMERIVELPCWLLRYGGRPQQVARQILTHLVRS